MNPKNYRTVLRSALAALAVAAVMALPVAPARAQSAPPDHTAHAAHVAADSAPTTAPSNVPLDDQVAELRSKVGKLEAALQQRQVAKGGGAASGMGAMGAMPSGGSGATPGMGPGSSGRMGGMDNMMGMTQGSGLPMGQTGAMPGGGMGMMQGMMQSEMGGMGSMPGGGGMAGGGGMGAMMGMDNSMMGMMGMSPGGGMGGDGMPMQTALPGFPGASHLYHIGGTGFFLDHNEHIILTVPQQASLNAVKEKALLDKAATQRRIEAAEQELWTLTADDQPDIEKIQAKIVEIEKLRGGQRVAFIRAVGEAAKLLTDPQRQSLLGMQPPQTQSPQPAPGMGGGGMGDM